MGRRLLLILGMMLSASSMAPVARGQDEGSNPPPPEPTPVVSPLAPATFPEDLALPAAPPGSESDEPGALRTAPPEEKKKRKTITDDPAATNNAREKNDSTAKAGRRPEGPAWRGDPARLRSDENVVLTQAPATSSAGPPGPPVPATAPSGVAGGPEPSRAAVDRLPLGKQSVAVSVDVQAPASMNLNQEATLKLVVRNTGTSDALNVDVQDELPEGLEYVSSQPEMHVKADSHLSFRINTLPAGSDRVITIRVKPIQDGPFRPCRDGPIRDRAASRGPGSSSPSSRST